MKVSVTIRTTFPPKLWRTLANSQGKRISPFGRLNGMKANYQAENKKDTLELNSGGPYMPGYRLLGFCQHLMGSC